MFALFNALRGEKFSKKGAFIKVKLSTHIYTIHVHYRLPYTYLINRTEVPFRQGQTKCLSSYFHESMNKVWTNGLCE